MRESAVGIARVSSKDQEDGYSLASQDKLISTYSDNHDFRLLKVFKIAETASKAKQRRIFREAMKFVAERVGLEPFRSLSRDYINYLLIRQIRHYVA